MLHHLFATPAAFRFANWLAQTLVCLCTPYLAVLGKVLDAAILFLSIGAASLVHLINRPVVLSRRRREVT